MTVHRLDGLDAFIVIDLDPTEPDAGAPTPPPALGTARCAPKLLVDGAGWLARSQTYALATAGVPASGASIGVNAPADGRDAALAAFAEAVAPWVRDGRLLVDAGKGVSDDALAPVWALDPRPAEVHAQRAALAGRSAAAAVAAARPGGLDGARVVLEVHDPVARAFAEAAAARGAQVLEVEPDTWRSTPCDVLAVGSKPGVIDHLVAAELDAGWVVPVGPLPVTARGLAVAGRRGVGVVPDFVALLGPVVAAYDALLAPGGDVVTAAEDLAGGVMAEVVGDERGPVLAACARAEAFLVTWRDGLPFGRPLAA